MNNTFILNKLILKSNLNTLFIKNLINSNKSYQIKNLNSKTMSLDDGNIVWVDLEMTGLDINNDHIIEMACLITDKDLNVIAEGPDLVIKQSDELLDGMNDWCKKTHGESGLTEQVRNSKIDLKTAEQMMLEFIKKYTPKGKCPLAGNSIHVDRIFLNKYMGDFLGHLHYRIIDVSTIKELAKRWYPEQKFFEKAGAHRALGDIKESIKELKYYRSVLFKE